MEEIRFRYPVFPKSRLILLARMRTLKRGRRAEFECQGYVADRLVFSGTIIGVPLSRSSSASDGTE